MANADKGEVDLVIGGMTYTMVLNVNAMCELETLMSTPTRRVTFQDVLIGVKHQSTVAFRALLWCSLREHHKDVTLEGAGRLLDGAGGMDGFMKKYADLVFAATPAKSDLESLGVRDPNPPKAQRRKRLAGTGTRSTSKHVTPA